MKKNISFRLLMILTLFQLFFSCNKERLSNTFEKNQALLADNNNSLHKTITGKSSVLTSGTEYIIRNKHTQKVIDIKGGITAAGTQLWQGNIDLTEAQYFRLLPVGPPSDNIFQIKSQLSGLFLSVKYKLLISDGSASPPLNDNYYITQENEFPTNNSPIQTPTNVNNKNQYWKLITAESEENTFYIQSVRYPTKVIKPVTDIAKSALFITDYTAAIRKQWIFQPIPKKASDLVISNFSYKTSSRRITGKITWKDNSSNEDFFKIAVTRNGGITWMLAERPANGTNTVSFNFTFGAKASEEGKNKEHCLTITAGNKWGGELSKKVCKTPTYIDDATPPDPIPTAASFSIYDRSGCYSNTSSCAGGISLKLSPINLTGTVGKNDPLLMTLTNGHVEIKDPFTSCCVWSYSYILGLRIGTWRLEYNVGGVWIGFADLNLTSGTNIFRICGDALSEGCNKGSTYPCD